MAYYAIGDIQGCYDSLQRLLEMVDFSPEDDQIWFVGDLVNRGKKSLKTLRFVKSLGDSAVTVLGNHDISLIAMHYGVIPQSTSLKKLLKSKHCDEHIDWLRNRPFIHTDENLGYCMVHAGISPHWSLAEAQSYAKEIEISLQGDNVAEWLKHVYGNKPALWSNELESYARHRYILNAFTRMRYCNTRNGSLNFKLKRPPKIKKMAKMKKKKNNAKQVPWFFLKGRKPIPLNIIFGHWSSLGFYQDNNVLALDTGCVWGGQLTIARLDLKAPMLVSHPCKKGY